MSGHTVEIAFDDGTCKVVDLSKYLTGPVFQTIKENPSCFADVKVCGSGIGWDCGADIDPNTLYYDIPIAASA